MPIPLITILIPAGVWVLSKAFVNVSNELQEEADEGSIIDVFGDSIRETSSATKFVAVASVAVAVAYTANRAFKK